jgi:hypothetical protein
MIATPVRAELPDGYWVRWRPYAGQPSGSRLIRMAPRFEDGTLTVVDDDLAATLEV